MIVVGGGCVDCGGDGGHADSSKVCQATEHLSVTNIGICFLVQCRGNTTFPIHQQESNPLTVHCSDNCHESSSDCLLSAASVGTVEVVQV